jgi:hypothetical protein
MVEKINLYRRETRLGAVAAISRRDYTGLTQGRPGDSKKTRLYRL